MKKIFFFSVLVTLVTLFNSCSDKQEFENLYYNGVDPQFSDAEMELGSLLIESLRKTSLILKEEKIELSNRIAVQEISSQVMLEVFNKRFPNYNNERLIVEQQLIAQQLSDRGDFTAPSLKSGVSEDSMPFTEMQINALNAIEHARANSYSAIAFMDKLAAINRRVKELVPKEEQPVLRQIIALTYHGLEEMNNLVAEGYLPGRAEVRPEVKIGIQLAHIPLRLSDFVKIAHATSEVIVLPEVVVIAPARGRGSGNSVSDWYMLRDAFGNYYQDGSNSGFNNSSNPTSWWDYWGRCASSIAGGAITTGATGFLGGAAVGTVTLPVIGTVSGAIVGSIAGAIGGALVGAASGC